MKICLKDLAPASQEIYEDNRAVWRGICMRMQWRSGNIEQLSYTHSATQPFSYSAIQPSSHSVLQPSSHAVIQPFSHSAIQSFSHSVIQPFSHSVIQPFSPSAIQSFSHSVIQPFSHSITQPFSHSAIQSFSHSVIQTYSWYILLKCTFYYNPQWKPTNVWPCTAFPFWYVFHSISRAKLKMYDHVWPFRRRE